MDCDCSGAMRRVNKAWIILLSCVMILLLRTLFGLYLYYITSHVIFQASLYDGIIYLHSLNLLSHSLFVTGVFFIPVMALVFRKLDYMKFLYCIFILQLVSVICLSIDINFITLSFSIIMMSFCSAASLILIFNLWSLSTPRYRYLLLAAAVIIYSSAYRLLLEVGIIDKQISFITKHDFILLMQLCIVLLFLCLLAYRVEKKYRYTSKRFYMRLVLNIVYLMEHGTVFLKLLVINSAIIAISDYVYNISTSVLLNHFANLHVSWIVLFIVMQMLFASIIFMLLHWMGSRLKLWVIFILLVSVVVFIPYAYDSAYSVVHSHTSIHFSILLYMKIISFIVYIALQAFCINYILSKYNRNQTIALASFFVCVAALSSFGFLLGGS